MNIEPSARKITLISGSLQLMRRPARAFRRRYPGAMRVGTSSLAVAAAVVVLAGCGESKTRTPTSRRPPARVKVIQPGAPGEPSREVVATADAAGQDGHTKADVEFMQGMIHHHQQAIVMTDWVPDRTQSTSIRLMAQRIEVSQSDEMKLMRDWLKKRDVDPSDHSHRHQPMPGMVNSRQLAKLKARQGRRVRPPVPALHDPAPPGRADDGPAARGRGRRRRAEIGLFIMHVDADQAIEIERMQELARGRAARGRPGSPSRLGRRARGRVVSKRA